MESFIFFAGIGVLSLGAVFLILFGIYSIIEKQKRAALRTLIVLLIYIPCSVLLLYYSIFVTTIVLVIAFLLSLILFARFGNKAIKFEIPKEKYDERDVMFSRNTLKENTPAFDAYYKMRPENKLADDKWRKEAGLMAPGSVFYNDILMNAAKASFQTVNLLQPLVEGKKQKNTSEVSQQQLASFIKKWGIKLGALDIGFTELKPHHMYSHIGRGEQYGNPVQLDHKYAIAFTVEMSHQSLSYNPKGPVVMESAQQYLNAGQIAVQLAQFIRNMGYDARAHIDANYRLICPIVAQDAGLGMIGRMGLLMTPKLGPRVRLGVVSTNLEIPVEKPKHDYSAIHFCEACKKCADNCPSQSIPKHSVTLEENPKRWLISHEKCFTYWCKSGTDCGRCVAVCPYSHPDNFIHNLVRWMIRRNPINRWLALQLDNFFYGQKPTILSQKSWFES